MAYTLRSGIVRKPIRAVLYGAEGIGKTTFARDFLQDRKGAMIDTEEGSYQLDVLRYPVPDSWTGLLGMVDDAAKNPDLHAICIDTLDQAEALCAKHVCTVKRIDNLEDLQYGSGYKYNLSEFNNLLKKLDACIAAGKDVLCIGHARTRKFEEPEQMGSYDRWELKLQSSQNCSISQRVKEWSDLLLFANYKINLITEDTKSKTKKGTGGKRVMYTSHNPCWDAKNRFGLKDELPFLYSEISGLYLSSETPQETNKKPPKTASKPKVEEIPKEEEKASEAPKTPNNDYDVEQVKNLPENLAALMIKDKVTLFELRAWTEKQGYYDFSVPVESWEPDYLSMYLPKVWDTIVNDVKASREELPF